ncbi:MAG: hypothetical protein JKY65_12770 [Planctomycetes bacterium]|nr:hypothetical protein [Planctomycetota bacterium]
MLFERDSEFDLLLAVLGTLGLLVWALEPVVRLVGPPWGPLLAIAAGWPTVANLLRYKRAPMGCAVVPAGILLFALARATNLAPEIQAFGLLIPNLPFYLWVSAIKPLLERRAATTAIASIAASDDPTAWAAYLEHPRLQVRHAAAQALATRPFADVSGLLASPLQSVEPGVRGAAAETIRAAGLREKDSVAAWLSEQAQGGSAGLPAAGLLAELDPALALKLVTPESSHTFRLAVAEGLLHRQPLDGESAAPLLVTVVTSGESKDQRGDAYYLAARFSSEDEALTNALLAALREREGVPSVEEVALLGELGRNGGDARRAAAYTGLEDYDMAAAALEAVEAIARRTENALGEGQAEVVAALSNSKESIRKRHPEGENRLADQLLDRLETLLDSLAPTKSG